MRLKNSKPLIMAIGLGAIAGMRAAAAPAITAHILSNNPSKRFLKSPLGFMQSKGLAIALKILAEGELVGDKLPNTPSRTEPGGVIARCISGALAGASIYKASGNNFLTGALLGSGAALASTYACHSLRKETGLKFKIFDPFVGAIEDGVVIGGGIVLTKLA